MTRKDYVAIAEAIFRTRQSFEIPFNPNKLVQTCALVDCARNIAVIMAQDNPRFDRERFLKACGVQS